MTPFFITGLPRSRTAWLANFFTTDHSFCYHDISRVGSVWAILESTSSDFVGDSDSGLLTLVDSLLIRFYIIPLIVQQKVLSDILLSITNTPEQRKVTFEKQWK
jgi:hypothetical protein